MVIRYVKMVIMTTLLMICRPSTIIMLICCLVHITLSVMTIMMKTGDFAKDGRKKGQKGPEVKWHYLIFAVC